MLQANCIDVVVFTVSGIVRSNYLLACFRSGSDSSVESSNIQKSIIIPSASNNNAPTPPPRPSQPNQGAPRDNHLKLLGSNDTKAKEGTGSNEISTSAPTPPPRPQQSQVSNHTCVHMSAFMTFLSLQ